MVQYNKYNTKPICNTPISSSQKTGIEDANTLAETGMSRHHLLQRVK